MFFNREQKKMAEKYSASHLRDLYAFSESKLQSSAKKGDVIALKAYMKAHHRYEYALLYRQTPEFKEKQRKKYKKQRSKHGKQR